jgi:hypothetical protein
MHLPADPADVASIDAIITAAYDVISGPAGQKRDWDRERSLFIPGARLIPAARTAGEMNRDGTITPQLLDVDSYIERSRDYVEKNGFFEKEIARRTEEFGQHRSCLEHLRVAPQGGRSTTVHARDQQHSVAL